MSYNSHQMVSVVFVYIELTDEICPERNYYINKDAFLSCMPKIESLIDINALILYLMRYHILTNIKEVEEVGSVYLSIQTLLNNLFTLTERNGRRDGYFILYKCFCESRKEVPLGHGDIVNELEKYGMFMLQNDVQ